MNEANNLRGIDDVSLEGIKTHGVPRSPKWEDCKKEFEKNNPKVCAVCGDTEGIQLHHKKPFHLHPELELESSNLIWLCENQKGLFCHLYFGHWGSFKNKYNSDIDSDAKLWNTRFNNTQPMV